MFTPSTYSYNCTRQCNLLEHGKQITRALTKRSLISSEKLAAFIAKTCRNFMNVLNEEGRSAVHVAASVGSYDILEWLLNQKDVIIDGHDFVTGSTPLHCAIFHGQLDCAILLLRYGAPLDRLDNDTYLPLQRLYDPECTYVDEMYAWGRNTNHNLALTTDGSIAKSAHSMLPYFRIGDISSIDDIAIGTYHTLFLLNHEKGLYSVGHGKGGRLGHGGEHSYSVPTKVEIKNSNIFAISVSKYHSLIATRSEVWSCGLNKYHALGLPDDEGFEVLKFTKVLDILGNTRINGIVACEQYSVMYCENNHIYFWGTNIGQIPMKGKNEIVKRPYLFMIKGDPKIKLLSASNKAVAVWTEYDIILLYYNYLTQRIKPPHSDCNIKSLLINDGDNLTGHLQLLILDQKNGVYIWSQIENIYYRCSFTPFALKPDKINKILWSNNEFYILYDKELYSGGIYSQSDITSLNKNSNTKEEEKVSTNKDLPTCTTLLDTNTENINDSVLFDLWQEVKPTSKIFISKAKVISIKIEHIPYFNRIIDIFADVDCKSFIVKEKVSERRINGTFIPNEFFKAIYLDIEEFYENSPTFIQSFEGNDYNFDKDLPLKCDCILHIGDELYPAHKIILIDRAPGLQDLFLSSGRHIYLDHINNLNGQILKLLIRLIYTDKEPTRTEIEIAFNRVENFYSARKKFVDIVKEFGIHTPQMNAASLFHLPYNYEDFVHLSDISIKCSDGPPIRTHKSILMAHSEYFYTIINNQWVQDTIEMQTVPYNYMYFIVSCLYNNHKNFNDSLFLSIYKTCKNDLKMNISWYQIIIYCDQLLLDNLRAFCQINLAKQINIGNCLRMLKFANTYNCHLMADCCNNFIVENFPRFIYKTSIRDWDHFDKNDLIALRNIYLKLCYNNALKCRQISTHPEAIDDNILLQFVEDFQLDLDDFYLHESIDDEALLQLVKDIKIDLYDPWIPSLKKSPNEDICGNSKSSKFLEQYRLQRPVRKFELEAISAMKKTIFSNDGDSVEGKSQFITSPRREKQDLCASFEEEDNWIKLEKRKIRKPYIIEQQEQSSTSPMFSFTNLNNLLNSTTNAECSENDSSSASSINAGSPSKSRTIDIDLCSLIPQYSKMTQKQRKCLLSTKKRSISHSTSNAIDVTEIVNPWNISNTKNTLKENLDFNKSNENKFDPNSFANIIRNKGASYVPEISPPELTNCKGNRLKRLLQLNEKQKVVKNKPLHLIQLEEKAILELKEFYNVDNATDEVIIVERLSQLQ